MRELNYIDFHDMINMVLEKFEDENSSLLEEIAQEFIEIVGKINNLEFDRPSKCPNDKFCDYKNLCKMNAI